MPTPISPSGDRDIVSVSQLNRRAKQLLETHLPLIWVEGELSNFARPSSGHWYFTLKDDQAQVRCAMFRGRNQLVRFGPAQGQQVLLRARVSLYEGRGDYQLIVEHMEEAGFGALQRAFEELKQRLGQEGLFDQAHKKSLPSLPHHIGVITSPTGAAIRDILSVLKRRFPAIPVTVIPVPVQGKDAAPAIARALEFANSSGLFDVLVLARGGGSLEDLWPFNEEIVARALFDSELPVVSAVGHEVDFSIADFVADLRAPTPSAAAELLVPEAAEWQARFQGYARLLGQAMNRRLKAEQIRLHNLRSRLRHPGERLQQQTQRLDGLELRLGQAIRKQLSYKQQRLQNLVLRQKPLHPGMRLRQLSERVQQLNKHLNQAMRHSLQTKKQRLSESARLLNSVSPLNTLGRGYAIVRTPEGKVIHSADQVQVGDQLSSRLARGEVISRVELTRDTTDAKN